MKKVKYKTHKFFGYKADNWAKHYKNYGRFCIGADKRNRHEKFYKIKLKEIAEEINLN